MIFNRRSATLYYNRLRFTYIFALRECTWLPTAEGLCERQHVRLRAAWEGLGATLAAEISAMVRAESAREAQAVALQVRSAQKTLYQSADPLACQEEVEILAGARYVRQLGVQEHARAVAQRAHETALCHADPQVVAVRWGAIEQAARTARAEAWITRKTTPERWQFAHDAALIDAYIEAVASDRQERFRALEEWDLRAAADIQALQDLMEADRQASLALAESDWQEFMQELAALKAESDQKFAESEQQAAALAAGLAEQAAQTTQLQIDFAHMQPTFRGHWNVFFE